MCVVTILASESLVYNSLSNAGFVAFTCTLKAYSIHTQLDFYDQHLYM